MYKKFKLLSVFVFFITVVMSSAYAASAGKELKPHHKGAGLTCIECHETEKPQYPAEETVCINCHGSKDELMEKSKALENNPHYDHEGGLDCITCHKEHIPSVLYCKDCHEWELKTP